jgi:hypothetical protein
LDNLDTVLKFGSVIQYVKEGTGILLVMPYDKDSIFDLDNIVCLPENF